MIISSLITKKTDNGKTNQHHSPKEGEWGKNGTDFGGSHQELLINLLFILARNWIFVKRKNDLFYIKVRFERFYFRNIKTLAFSMT